MIVSKTPRGFDLIEFLDRYGAKCSLQKSSLAEDDAIWFGIDDPEPKMLATDAIRLGIETEQATGWVAYGLPEELSLTTRMHLTRAQVLMLLPHLHAFVDTGDITPVGWRQHSVNYARGEKCPQTLETAQAAWDRDQELIEDQRREIERLKLKLNQERQCRGTNCTSTDGTGHSAECMAEHDAAIGVYPNSGITSPKLEERYIVVKLKDLIPSQAQELRDYLTRAAVPTRDCVVVEADWPQYEQVVDMVVGDQKC